MPKPTVQKSAATVRTRRTLVQLLKQEGPLEAQELATRLNISAMAVRQHLYALHEEQLVTYQEVPRPRGRPAKRWQLTPAADRLFPEAYAELTLSLLQSIPAAFGPEALERLIALRSAQQIAAYRAQLADQTGLARRLAALAALRTQEGYMADVQPQADGSFVLVEKHCPICVAAVACTGLCRSELEVFQAVLGGQVRIERTDHMVAGAARCVYRVSADSGEANGSAV